MKLEYASKWLNSIKKEKKTRKAAKRATPGCRARGHALKACFVDGEKIRHEGSCPTVWEGRFSASSGGIVYKGEVYKALSSFAAAHYEAERKDRTEASNGWLECEVHRSGQWISTFNLRKLI